MRLEHRHQTFVLQSARRRQRRRNLGRVMGVVVIHARRARGRADQLEPPAGAVKLGEAGNGPLLVSPRKPGRLQRSRGVQRVVRARHAQRDLVTAPVKAGATVRERRLRRVVGDDLDTHRRLPRGLASRVRRKRPAGDQLEQLGPVPYDDPRPRPGQERAKRLAQLDQ